MTTDAQQSEVMNDYGKLPLTFEANHGQTDARVDFITRASGGTVFLTPTSAVFSIQNSESSPPAADQNSESPEFSPLSPLGRGDGGEGVPTTGVAIHMQIVGANPNAEPAGQQRQPGIVNYFIGNDPSQWHANIPTFGRVQYDDVYPGIDLAYYGGSNPSPSGRGDRGEGAGLEYDFIVSPGADPNAIMLNFAGTDSVEINPQGDLVLHTAAGDVVQQKPFTYQEAGQTRQEVASRYVLDGTQVSFEVGAYDATRPLVIDPLVMGYSTYLGSATGNDTTHGITLDGPGNAYLTGLTVSTDFPTTPGAYDTTDNRGWDAYVAKLNSAGSALVYSTYLGGAYYDSAASVVTDDDGNGYVAGSTTSPDYPTTANAFDPSHNGNNDVFVTKLSPDGSALLHSTFIGGSNSDSGSGVAVDADGNAYVTGLTVSANFPTTLGAFDESFNGQNDAFLTKLSATGSSLSYSTYLGGSDNSDSGKCVAVDSDGIAYVVGIAGSTNFPVTSGAFDTTHNGNYDVFAAKIKADGSAPIYSTYVGGPGDDYGDGGILLDAGGNLHISGLARSGFPTTAGAFDVSYNGGGDGFVTKLNADGSALVYSTFLGGTGYDFGGGIAVDVGGNVYASGGTGSDNFPTTGGAFDTTYNGGQYDAFLLKLNSSGSALLYSTYLGGGSLEYAVAMSIDDAGHIYFAGSTQSSNFPTTPGALKGRMRGGQTNGFVTKFIDT